MIPSVNGYKFLELRFYFDRKNKITHRDKMDWEGIELFLNVKSMRDIPTN